MCESVEKLLKCCFAGFVFCLLFSLADPGSLVAYAGSRSRCLLKKKRKSRLCRKYAVPGKPGERFVLVSQFPRRFRLCVGPYLLARFRSGHGRRGFDKRREGDKKTPVGTYRITWMAARHEPRRSNKREAQLRRYKIRPKAAWCKPDPKTGVSHFNRHHGPRGERLWRRPYGGRRAVVMTLNYPNRKDRAKGRTGSCIEIHSSFHLRGSAGCVTLLPKAARRIYDCVAPGTRVELRKRL